MRRRLVRRVGLSAALLLGAPLLASGCAASRAAQPDANFHASVHDFIVVRQVLARRAQAVLHDDKSAFMATLDPDDPAFRTREAVMFANLEKLPVGSMSYESSTSGVPPAKVPGDDPTLEPEVYENVLLKGTDYHPVGIAVDMTFVERDGTWYLGADTTATSDANDASARPWAGPPIAVAKQGPLIVVADAKPPGVATKVETIVRADLVRDANILHVPMQERVLVDVTRAGNVTKFANKEEAGGVTYSVDAVKNFQAYQVAGWRVKINPNQLPYLYSYPVLLRHELTHFLTRQYLGRVPLWLSEGLAEYVAHQPLGLPSEQMTAADYARLMKRPRVLIDSGLFGDDPATDYPLAMAIVTYLVHQGGMADIFSLMKTFAAYDDAPYEDQHDAAALAKVYGPGFTPKLVADNAFNLLAALR